MMTTMMKKPRRLLDPAEFEIPPITADPRHAAAAADLEAVERRLAEAEARIVRARARQRGDTTPGRSIAVMARDLVSGGKIISGSPTAEREAGEEEAHILREAVYEKALALADIVGELSYETCTRHHDNLGEAYRAMLDGMRQVHLAARVVFETSARLSVAGFRVTSGNFPAFIPPAALALGDPDVPHSGQANAFLQWLVQRGIV
jgi:hypothetical protein